MAEYVIVVQEEDEEAHKACLYVLEPRTPFLSKRKEAAFWKTVGEEVTEAVASAGLPFESAMLFIKRARRASMKRVSLCALANDAEGEGWRVFTSSSKPAEPASPMTEDEKLQFEEARLLAEEIAKRNRDAIPDMEDEIISIEEFEDMLRGDSVD